MSLILAIAQICLTPNGLDWGHVTMKRTGQYHLECQQYYIQCLDKKNPSVYGKADRWQADTLAFCIGNKK